MTRLTPLTEGIAWGTTAITAGAMSALVEGASGLETLLATYGPWGVIALGGAFLLRFVVQESRDDIQEILRQQRLINQKLRILKTDTVLGEEELAGD